MFRKKLKQRALETEPDFRYRGTESSRLEGLSDAVFAFALTLLVVSLEVPSNFDALLKAFEGFFAFIPCVVLLFMIWYEHYIFFLRYGLKDIRTILLNIMLLFMVLFYVYPLKFLFTMFYLTGKNLYLGFFKGHDVNALFDKLGDTVIHGYQVPQLMVLYGLGAATIFFLFTLLYWHAYRRREELQLTTIEKVRTRFSIIGNVFSGAIPLTSAIVAYIFRETPGTAGFLSGMVYCLFAFYAIISTREKKALTKVKAVEPSE